MRPAFSGLFRIKTKALNPRFGVNTLRFKHRACACARRDPVRSHTGEGYTEKSSSEKSKADSTKRRAGNENPADHSDKDDPVKGHTGEGYTEKGKDGSTRPG